MSGGAPNTVRDDERGYVVNSRDGAAVTERVAMLLGVTT